MAGPERNPWRRLLALPNESRTKTVVVAFLVSLVCAVLVSAATVVLRPIQTANRAAEERARIAELVRGVPGMSALLEQSGGTLSTLAVELDSGRAAADVTPATLDVALADPANWTALEPGADPAGLGRRPDYAQVFLLRDGDGQSDGQGDGQGDGRGDGRGDGEGGGVSLALLPITGRGYGGRIDALLALQGDMNTIAGIAITRHAETPGLGGRIEEASWRASFPGTEVRDASGRIRFDVARGEASTAHEVDGITGATRTGNGIAGMVRFWLGPDGYGPLLRAIERGEY